MSSSKIVAPKMQSKYVLAYLLACLCVCVCWMSKNSSAVSEWQWHRLLTFNGMLPFFTCTFEQFQMFWHTIFRIISMRISIYFEFNFRSVPKFSPSLFDYSSFAANLCVTSEYVYCFSRSNLFSTLFPMFLMQCLCARNAFICVIIS